MYLYIYPVLPCPFLEIKGTYSTGHNMKVHNNGETPPPPHPVTMYGAKSRETTVVFLVNNIYASDDISFDCPGRERCKNRRIVLTASKRSFNSIQLIACRSSRIDAKEKGMSNYLATAWNGRLKLLRTFIFYTIGKV